MQTLLDPCIFRLFRLFLSLLCLVNSQITIIMPIPFPYKLLPPLDRGSKMPKPFYLQLLSSPSLLFPVSESSRCPGKDAIPICAARLKRSLLLFPKLYTGKPLQNTTSKEGVETGERSFLISAVYIYIAVEEHFAAAGQA